MTTLHCRITGSARSLPRPNYFPLLPPISPADAKRFCCKITSKSWNLPAHNYIPLFNCLIKPDLGKCGLTRGNLEMFKCFTPVLPEGSKKFIKGGTDFLYIIQEDKLAIVLPECMETYIREGRIEDLLMSKTEDTLEIKLNKRRETLELKEYIGNLEKLTRGTGPKRKSRKLSLQTRIFEDKDSAADLEEKKSIEKIQPQPERVDSVRKKLEKVKKLGLPPVLHLRKLDGTFGYLMTGGGDEGDVEFKAGELNEQEIDLETRSKVISGQFIESEKKFIPGKLIKVGGSLKDERFLPGQTVITKKGPVFVAGQVMCQSSGVTNFVPGQHLRTANGSIEFVPGQFIHQDDGELRFVPGQIIKNLQSGPTFIPGQCMTIGNESRFVPGTVIEPGFFVPGRVVEENGQVKYIAGEVVETEEGYKFVCDEGGDGELEFNLQSWAVEDTGGIGAEQARVEIDTAANPFASIIPTELTPMTPSDYGTIFDTTSSQTMVDSKVLETLMLAGVDVGDSVIVPPVHVELNHPSVTNPTEMSNGTIKHKLQRSVSVNTFTVYQKILSSMRESVDELEEIFDQLEIKNSTTIAEEGQQEFNITKIENALKQSKFKEQSDIIKSLVLSAIGQIIQESGDGGSGELSLSEIKNQIMEKVKSIDIHQFALEHGKKSIAPIKEENHQREPSKPDTLEDLDKIQDFQEQYKNLQKKKHQLRRMSKLLSKPVDTKSFEHDLNILSDSIVQVLHEDKQNQLALQALFGNSKVLEKFFETSQNLKNAQGGSIREHFISSLNSLTDFNSEIQNDPESARGILQDATKLTNDKAMLEKLEVLLNSDNLSQKPEISTEPFNFVLRKSMIRKLLIENGQVDKNDQEKLDLYCDLVLEMIYPNVKTTPSIEDQAEESNFETQITELVDEIISEISTNPTYCVIDKENFKAVVPKDAASLILSGEARYSIIDDTGVRFFEPNKVQHDVRITEITTPEAEKICGFSYDESAIRSTQTNRQIYHSIEESHDDLDDFNLPVEQLLDSSVAKSKLSCKQSGKRRGTSPRSAQQILASPESSLLSKSERLQSHRNATIAELIETEEEFIRDLETILTQYYKGAEVSHDKNVCESRDIVFGNMIQIYEFHKNVLLDALKGNVDSAKMIGRSFVRLERDFDSHAKYVENEAAAEEFLRENPDVVDFYDNISASSSTPRSLIEQLRLPNQRLNDYSLILEELAGFNNDLGETTLDLEKALELMKILPQKSSDEKFLNNIEGYRGSVKSLGRLIYHDWFSLTDSCGKSKERYLFLFNGRILVTKVKRITEDRSVFILKDVLRLPDLEVTGDDLNSFSLYEPSTGGKYRLEHVDSEAKDRWFSKVSTFVQLPKKPHRQDSVVPESGNSSEDEGKSDRTISNKSESVKKSSIIKQTKIKESESKLIEEIVDENLEEVKKQQVEKPVLQAPGEAKSESLESSETKKSKRTAQKVSSDEEVKVSSSKVEEKVTLSNSTSASNVVILRRDSLKMDTEKGPKLVTGVKSVQCEPGDAATLSVKFNSNTPSTITWLKDNKPLDDRLADRIKITSIQNAHTMQLLNCHDEDSGLYTARCTNEFGSLSSSGILTVHELTADERAVLISQNSPNFQVKFKDVDLIENTVACFMIAVGGDPIPNIRMYKNDKPLVYDDRIKLEKSDLPGHFDLLINHIQAEDAGLYECRASNIYGSESFKAQINVVEEKDIFHGCEEGDGSGGPIDFRWFRDGKNFTPEERFKVMFKDDEDTLALVFQHVTPEDAGLYTCVASTSSGNISCSAELTVKGAIHQLLREPKAPCIITKLEPITQLNTGGSGMLEIKVEGYPKPTTTWLKDGKEIKASEKYRFLHEDDESTALIIKNVELSDRGVYKCVATNELGEETTESSVGIKSGPKFKEKMENFECLNGESIEMKIVVEGCPTPELKWYKDGQEIKSSSKLTITSTSTETHILKISSVKIEDSGAYSVVATNSEGQMSCFWNMKVNTVPKIITGLSSKVEKEVGEEVIFKIITETSTDEISWEIDGKKLDSKKYKISSNENEHSLTLPKLARNASGTIKCTASNKYGSDESSAELFIKRKPEIIEKLKPVCTNVGESAEFSVKVDAYPKPKVKWFLGDVVIDGKKYSDDGQNFKLKLPNVDASGTVKVKLENDYGYDEDEASLTVKSKPKFKQGLKDVVAIENESLDMKIIVEGTPTPNLTMYHNGTEVETSARIKITKESTETYHMTFNVVLPSDGGDWVLKAQNECGQVESACKITIEGKPVFEKKLSNTIEVVESENVELSVTIHGSPEPVIRWFLKNEEIQVSKHISIITNGNLAEQTLESRLIINEVTMEEVGDLRVVAENKHGKGESEGLLKILSLAELKCPKFVGELKDSVFKKGEQGVLSVIVKGNPPPQISWYKDGELLPKSACVQNGEEYSLQIPNVSQLSKGQYAVIAENEHGKIQSEASVDVLFKPEIQGLKNTSVAPGDEIILQATITANPEPSQVHWEKDGKKIKDTDAGISFEKGVATVKIPKAEKADEGEYKVVASNAIGESQEKIKVAVKSEPPTFLKGLKDLEINAGDELNLEVKVSGIPKPTVSWAKDGVPIKEEEIKIDNEYYSLSIPNAGLENVGKYTVTAQSVSGTAETVGKVKILLSKPKFLKSLPRRESFMELDDLLLKVKVEGSPKPQVAWLKDGVPLEPSDRIKIETLPDGNCKLLISNLSPMDRGAYSVILKNDAGETSSSSNIEVHGKHRKPEFLENLSGPNGIAQHGHPIKLQAKISGHPFPEIKWFKDGKPIRPGEHFAVETKPDGAICATISDAKESDAGLYRLTLSNDKGEISQEIPINVSPAPIKPKFAKGLADANVVEGFPLLLESIISSNPRPKLSVLKDGVPIPLEIKIEDLVPGVQLKAQICIPAISAEQGGIYELVAENSEGATKSRAEIGVIPKANEGPEEAPSFLQEIKVGQTVDEGEPISITGKVTGNPLPEVEWTKDGVPIGKGTFDGKNVEFKVPAATMQDAGLYECTLKNKLGEVSSKVPLQVRKIFVKPKFLNRFVDAQQVPTRDCKFGAKIMGIPFPTVSWFKNGTEPITPNDKYQIKKDGDVVTLVVKNCNDGDRAKYSCIIKNCEGEEKCEAELDVVSAIVSKPRQEPPTFLKKITPTSLYDGMDARFTACVEGFPEPKFEWFKNGVRIGEDGRVKFEKEGAGLLRLVIRKVTEADVGKYSLRIFNDFGDAECDAELKFESFEKHQRKPVEDLDYDKFKKSGVPLPLVDKPIISCMTDRHLTLSWKPSLSSGSSYPVTYRVEMAEVRDGEDGARGSSDFFEVRQGLRQCVCDIRNLDPFLDYKFRIRVENKYGMSEPSPYAITLRYKFDRTPTPWTPILSHPIPKDYDLEIPPHDGYTHPPKFLGQPHDTQYILKDVNGKILWFIYGYPKPNVRIEFNGRDITDEIGGGKWSMTYQNNGEIALYVNRMTEHLAGTYTAIASNTLGIATQAVKLGVAEPPRFITRPDETTIMLRKGGKVSAVVTGKPLPDIRFYKDWKPVFDTNRLKFQTLESEDGESVRITWELRDSIFKDAGLYSIVATNIGASTQTSFNVHIEESELDYNWKVYGPTRPSKPRFKPFADYYALGDEIGRGTQGITFHTTDRSTGSNYACKRMMGTGIRKVWMDNEINIMEGLSHPNITRMVEWFGEPNGTHLIMELADGGDLVRSILTRTDVTEWEIRNYIRQSLYGLEYLHDRGIAHLGLTPLDLLISRSGGRMLQITDFGLARRISSRLVPLEFGMPEFVAPEVVLGHGVGYAADMWSIGIITYLLLSGRSLFRGRNDMETMDNIKSGRWVYDETLKISSEARDFLHKLIVMESSTRLDIKRALQHPWILRDSWDRDAYLETRTLTTTYYDSLRDWYLNAQCRDIYRRRPLSGAYTHPSKMVYPPGEWSPPIGSPSREPKEFKASEAVYPRPNLDMEIGNVSSESKYQTGPDTYLLQLRDADFPARLRQYMKVAAARSPALALQLKDTAYDTQRSVIRERRKFTDIMDEEVDEERKTRISGYGGSKVIDPRRLRTEVGPHMDIQAEAEALVLSKREGLIPLFRIKPKQVIQAVMGKSLEIYCIVDGDPLPSVQWFKNELIVTETNRVKFVQEGSSLFKLTFSKILDFDMGQYKVVARNSNGQVTARFRINESDILDKSLEEIDTDYSIEKSEPSQVSQLSQSSGEIIYEGKFSKILQSSKNGYYTLVTQGVRNEFKSISTLKHVNISKCIELCENNDMNSSLHKSEGGSLLRVLSLKNYTEQTLCLISSQILDGLQYLHWRGLGLLNLEPGNILLNYEDTENPKIQLIDFSCLQKITRVGKDVNVYTDIEFTAPELLISEPTAWPTTDLWGLGCLLYILLSGHSPFLGETEEETKLNVLYVRYRFEYLYKDLSQEVTRLIMSLFTKSPMKRPSIEECFEHRWFLPSEFMIRKREKNVIKGGLLRQYTEEYFRKREGCWGTGANKTQLPNGG